MVYKIIILQPILITVKTLLLSGRTLVQKGVAYSGCKIYNHLPPQIKKISNNVALFKNTLKKLLLQYIFYSVDEYYQQNYNDYDC